MYRRFVVEQGLIDLLSSGQDSSVSTEMILQEFSKMVKVSDSKKSGGLLTLSIERGDPEQAAQWVNQLATLANHVTVAQLVSDLVGAIDTRIQNVENNISSKRQLAKQRREDRLVRLEEGLQIAKSLGISERQGVFNIVQNAASSGDVYGSEGSQVYQRGIKSLQAEISVLRERKSDDAFISGLRDLQEELARLRSIKIDETVVRAMTVDQAAFPPNQRIKPKRKLIVILGALLGLMLGVFAAFLMSFLDNQRKTEEVAA